MTSGESQTGHSLRLRRMLSPPLPPTWPGTREPPRIRRIASAAKLPAFNEFYLILYQM
jgi:hypothetical protein